MTTIQIMKKNVYNFYDTSPSVTLSQQGLS